MPGSESTTAVFVKGAFYKAFFCLGLGTAAYCSYHQVNAWFAPVATSSPAIETSGIQQKLSVLQEPGTSAGEGAVTQSQAQNLNATHEGFLSFKSNPNAFVKISPNEVKKDDKAEAAAGAVDPLASNSSAPSVSPTPGEATVDGKDAKSEGSGDANTYAMVNAPVIPIAQAAAFGYFGYGAQNPEAQAPAPVSNENNQNPYPSFPGGIPTGAHNGTGQANSGASGGSSGTSSGSTISSGNSGTYNGSGSTSSNGGSASPSAFLSQADILLLTSSMRATLPEQTLDVSGIKFEAGMAPGTVQNPQHVNHYTIKTSRWSTTEGLASDAGFIIKSSSITNQIEVNFSVRVQDLQQNFQTLSTVVHPSEVLVHSEIRNGKNYRIFELKLPNLALRATETMRQVVATLAYEVSSAGSVLSSDSHVNFVRGHFQTSNALWDQTQPNRAPAANEDVFVPDQVNYSMNLEKSP